GRARSPPDRRGPRRGGVRRPLAPRRARHPAARTQPLRARGRALVLRRRRFLPPGQAMNFEAILFDCDGVLVDSEPITNGALRESLHEAGWAITPEDCERLFIGRAVRDQRALIEQMTGKPWSEDWLQAFYARRNARLRAELKPI